MPGMYKKLTLCSIFFVKFGIPTTFKCQWQAVAVIKYFFNLTFDFTIGRRVLLEVSQPMFVAEITLTLFGRIVLQFVRGRHHFGRNSNIDGNIHSTFEICCQKLWRIIWHSVLQLISTKAYVLPNFKEFVKEILPNKYCPMSKICLVYFYRF
jgi:hypothetical protein